MSQHEVYLAIFCTLKTTSGFIFLLPVVSSDRATNRKQESLANAKVNARQHCVNEMPITGYVVEYNNFSLGMKIQKI